MTMPSPQQPIVPQQPRLRVLVAAGGTAGHLAPAIAVADELRAAGHEVRFAASRGRRDHLLLAEHGYDADLFTIGGLPRRPGLAQLRAIGRALLAVIACMRIVRRTRPDVLLAGGGFVSAPAAIAAWMRGVPVVTTEADAHLGLANRIAGRLSRRLCTAYPLPTMRRRQEVVGRPVGARFVERVAEPEQGRGAARAALGIPADARVLAVVGGSGGALRLNEATWEAWGRDPDPRVGDEPLWILHVSGLRDFGMFEAKGLASERYRLLDYCDDMPGLIAAADLVVTRPGGSVFEFAVLRRAAVLVPSPWVTGNHQERNAEWFTSRGAGELVADSELDGARLLSIAGRLLAPSGDAHRALLAANMGSLARPHAAATVARIVAQCGAAAARAAAARNRRMRDDELHDGAGGDQREPTAVRDRASDAPLAGRTFHMLGIGGAGVSALAILSRAWGAQVDGCDQTESTYSGLVRAQGIDVAIGHAATHVQPGADIVISSALDPAHPELVRASELGCTIVRRGELLGELTRLRPDTIVVAGAHGKSTTTGMLAHAATQLGLDPAVAVGAMVPGLADDGSAANVRAGAGPFLVEGDESDRTLLHLAPRVAVVTNIERDHHHTFATDDDVEALFAQWIRDQQPEVLVAGPGAALDRLVVHAQGRVVRFGDDPAELDTVLKRLSVPGRHNALNALAAAVALRELRGGDPAVEEAVLDSLGSFHGVGRRFELVGEASGVLVVDDYAHHPTEVAATIDAARSRAAQRGGHVLVVFQPHLYSRTEALWSAFADALAGADRAWVLPVYGAREQPIPGVTEQLIADALRERAPAVYAGTAAVDPETGDVGTIVGEAMAGDILITMGAGSVTRLAPRLRDALDASPTTSVPDWFEQGVSLSRFTTIGTGGEARWYARVETTEQLAATLAWAAEHELPVAVTGLGSNSLIADAGFDGVAIRLTGDLARIDIDAASGRVVLGGGASLAATVRLCREAGLAGFEFACAIPGTAGGALKMNAGAYGSELRDVLASARIVDATGVRTAAVDDLDLRYRHSNIGWQDVVAEVELQLTHDEPDAIRDRVKAMQARRTDTQPRAARTFGSVFQNPTSASAPHATADAFDAEGNLLGAGALVERAGLKGHAIGGACISPKHGNFIENVDAASTADVIALIELARATVLDRFGVELHTEVHLLAPTGYQPLFDGLATVPAPDGDA